MWMVGITHHSSINAKEEKILGPRVADGGFPVDPSHVRTFYAQVRALSKRKTSNDKQPRIATPQSKQ